MISILDRPTRPAHRSAAAPLAVLLVMATSLCPFGRCAASPAVPPDPVATMQRLAGELDLQTRLPRERPDPHEATPSDFKLHLPGASVILWSALAVGLGFALYALRDKLPGLRRRAPAVPPAPADGRQVEAAARMAEAGDDADELARLGRVGEAMHLLLLRALTELRARLGITLADSLTSREILGRVALPEGGRQALGELIGRVELAHFGGRPVSLDDYGTCRGIYERLVGAMLAPPAALPAA